MCSNYYMHEREDSLIQCSITAGFVSIPFPCILYIKNNTHDLTYIGTVYFMNILVYGYTTMYVYVLNY